MKYTSGLYDRLRLIRNKTKTVYKKEIMHAHTCECNNMKNHNDPIDLKNISLMQCTVHIYNYRYNSRYTRIKFIKLCVRLNYLQR